LKKLLSTSAKIDRTSTAFYWARVRPCFAGR
jgi:hypothetical protein